jgi:hypothetical protein
MLCLFCHRHVSASNAALLSAGFAPASEWSFYGARMQAAGASLSLPWGAYVVPGAKALTAGDMVQRVATIVGSGGKAIIYYNFGPDYAFPGNCWGVGNESRSLVPQIQVAHQLLASAEELLWAGSRPAASVAILSPRSSTPWDDLCSLFDDTCLFGADGKQRPRSRGGARQNRGAVEIRSGGDQCCATPSNIMDCTNSDQSIRTVDYMSEVYGDYHALAQVHNIPTEFVDETTLATNASKMTSLTTLLVSEPNLPAAAAAALIKWVKSGGHLILICAGGVLDETNTPAPTVWQELGLLKPGAPTNEFESWAPAARMNMHVAGEDVWGPTTVVNGSGLPPHGRDLAVKAFGRICQRGADDDLGGSDSVLATFTNGSTAVSLRKVGDGSVVRFSWLPGVSHSAAMYPGRDPPPGQPHPTMLTDASKWLAAAVGLARNSARTATAKVDVALVETPVLVSSLGAVVTILDWRPADTDRSTPLSLNVTLAFLPKSVESASTGTLTWTPTGSSGEWQSGVVEVSSPSAYADFISFHAKTDDTSSQRPGATSSRRSVAAFGAIPDDGKDDTLALRHALASCSSTGGAVYIPPGHYIVSALTVAQGGPLPTKTEDILPVPSNCHVFGGGRDEGASQTTIAFATTGGKDGLGVNGVDGCWWRMFGWCGNSSAGLCTSPPSNVSITDLHLSGSTNYTNYTQIAGQREHGSLIFFYQVNPQLPPIVGVNVERIFTESVAGDGMDYGDGVQQLLVSDVIQRDYLRCGVDQAGAGPVARDREIRGVVDLPSSEGVMAGNSIHIEEAENLTNVWVHHNIANNSMALSGCRNLTVEHNVVEGGIIVNGNAQLVVRHNSVLARDERCPDKGCCPGMISILAAQVARIVGNTLTVTGSCRPVGVEVWGNVEVYPFARDLLISGNAFEGKFEPLFREAPYNGTITLDGVEGVVISGNTFSDRPKAKDNVCECCRYGVKASCKNITIGR